jgi:hypothetical protein
MKEYLKEKENKMKRRNDMKLSEIVFDTGHCDESESLDLVNEFFETNNEPTTNGREYKGWRGASDGTVDPCRVSPYTFGLMERVSDHTYWEGEKDGNGFYDDNKLLGWPTDCRRTNYESGWTPRGSDEIN